MYWIFPCYMSENVLSWITHMTERLPRNITIVFTTPPHTAPTTNTKDTSSSDPVCNQNLYLMEVKHTLKFFIDLPL